MGGEPHELKGLSVCCDSVQGVIFPRFLAGVVYDACKYRQIVIQYGARHI